MRVDMQSWTVSDTTPILTLPTHSREQAPAAKHTRNSRLSQRVPRRADILPDRVEGDIVRKTSEAC